ncbi:hypothetical protein ACHAWC_008521 [Mediolabrus comicus]
MVKSRRRPSTLAIYAPLLLLACSRNDIHHADGFCIRRTTYTAALICRRRSTLLSLQEGNQNNSNNNNNDVESEEKETKTDIDNSYSWAELQADEELRQLEFKSSMKRKNMLFLPQRISKAIYTLGWMFVITGIILNSLGFAYVEKPGGGLGIGTLDQESFKEKCIGVMIVSLAVKRLVM